MDKNAKRNTQALAHYQAGQLREAEALCMQTLRNTPQQVDSLNILAAVRMAQNRPDEAIQLLNRLLAYAPNFLDGYLNRGDYLLQSGRYVEALNDAEKALTLQPNNLAALLVQGSAYLGLKDVSSALAAFTNANRQTPTDPRPLFRLGDVHYSGKQYEKALSYYDQALAQALPTPELLHNRGLTLLALQRVNEALTMADNALTLNPAMPLLYTLRGQALRQLSRHDEALQAFYAALALHPDYYEAHIHKITLLRLLSREADALAHAEKAVRLRPDAAEAYDHYAHCLLAVGQTREAMLAFDKAVSLAEHSSEIHHNRARALFEQGHYTEALDGFTASLTLAPHSATAHTNRGLALQALGDHQTAETHFVQANHIDPHCALSQFNLATHYLLHGEFTKGWPLYEARWQRLGVTNYRYPASQLWLGQTSLVEKTLLVHAEQGLGDMLQFCRYVPLLAAMGATIVFEVPDSLRVLLQSLDGKATLIPQGSSPPPFNYHCPLLSIPRALCTVMETIPHHVPYLAPTVEAKARWQNRLGAPSRPRIGLAWSGIVSHKNDLNRTMPLELLRPIFELNADFHVLQKEVRASDTAMMESQANLHFHETQLIDMNETAGLVEAMDLVISVDTSVAHLAGALAKPTLILLPFNPDFRWLLDRVESPWYPTATLIRQSARADWTNVIQQTVTLVTALCDNR